MVILRMEVPHGLKVLMITFLHLLLLTVRATITILKTLTVLGRYIPLAEYQKLPIAQGKTYELSFDAWSDRERNMVVGLGLSAPPWNNDQELIDFDTERKTYTVYLSSATFSGNTCRVIFDGGLVGLVNIDNVSLKNLVQVQALPLQMLPMMAFHLHGIQIQRLKATP